MNTDSAKIKELFLQLQNTSFPPFSKNEDLNNWITDFIETEAYFAGIASTQAKIRKKDYQLLEALEKKLLNIKVGKSDVDLLNKWHEYLILLKKIAALLKQ